MLDANNLNFESDHDSQDAMKDELRLDNAAFLHFGKSSMNLDFNRNDEIGCKIRKATMSVRCDIKID